LEGRRRKGNRGSEKRTKGEKKRLRKNRKLKSRTSLERSSIQVICEAGENAEKVKKDAGTLFFIEQKLSLDTERAGDKSGER